jgi:hypothetical protein
VGSGEVFAGQKECSVRTLESRPFRVVGASKITINCIKEFVIIICQRIIEDLNYLTIEPTKHNILYIVNNQWNFL